MPTDTLGKRQLAVAAGTCLAAAFVGGAFGSIATAPYKMEDVNVADIGLWLGATGGLITAIAWCAIMTRATAGKSPHGVVRFGTYLGIAAGIVSTAILHGGLMISAREWVPLGLGFGLVCGIPAGALVGAVFSAAWRTQDGPPTMSPE